MQEATRGNGNVVSPRRPADPPWRERVAHRTTPPDIAVELRDVRRSLGWSRAEAARRLYVSRTALWHLEAPVGDRLPSVELAEELICGYGLDERRPWLAARLREVARPFAGRSSPYRTARTGRQAR